MNHDLLEVEALEYAKRLYALAPEGMKVKIPEITFFTLARGTDNWPGRYCHPSMQEMTRAELKRLIDDKTILLIREAFTQ